MTIYTEFWLTVSMFTRKKSPANFYSVQLKFKVNGPNVWQRIWVLNNPMRHFRNVQFSEMLSCEHYSWVWFFCLHQSVKNWNPCQGLCRLQAKIQKYSWALRWDKSTHCWHYRISRKRDGKILHFYKLFYRYNWNKINMCLHKTLTFRVIELLKLSCKFHWTMNLYKFEEM